jgi:competence protein ComFB
VETGDLNITNANYARVIAVMDKFLTEQYKDFCACPRCRCDIAAISLNYLPPHYIVEMDAVKEHGSPWVMVETAVTEAIDRVMEKPNHPRSKISLGMSDTQRSSSFKS